MEALFDAAAGIVDDAVLIDGDQPKLRTLRFKPKAALLSAAASPASDVEVEVITVDASPAPSPPSEPASKPAEHTMVLRVPLAAAAASAAPATWKRKLDVAAPAISSKRGNVDSWLRCDECDAWHVVPPTHAHTVHALAAGEWTCGDATWASLECATVDGEDGEDEDGNEVGSIAWLFGRFDGKRGSLVTLPTDTAAKRKMVLKLTGLVVFPLDGEAAYTLAQSATESGEWREQKTRRNLSGHELVAQLRLDGRDGVADLIEAQDASCLFFYGDGEYCDVHRDKSKDAERWMARLTETPNKEHYIMIQGYDGVVYNVAMTGPFAYRGEDGTLLAQRRHAVPASSGDGDIVTLLITLAGEARDFDEEFVSRLEDVEATDDLWNDFVCEKYKRSSADISKADKRKGGACDATLPPPRARPPTFPEHAHLTHAPPPHDLSHAANKCTVDGCDCSAATTAECTDECIAHEGEHVKQATSNGACDAALTASPRRSPSTRT
jgi:hypothetical protein